MAIKITKLPTGKNVRLNMLIYGKTGSGKTRLLGSAQRCDLTRPMLFVNIEGGTASLDPNDNIDVFSPQNFGQLQELYDFLRHENTEYRSVGIDSLTEIQRKLSMGEITGSLEDDASYSNLAGHTPPDRYDWLQSGDQMRRFIRAFRDLAYLPDQRRRIHVLFTALERIDEKFLVVCPSLPGALGPESGAFVDILGRLTLEHIEIDDKIRSVRRLVMTETQDDSVTYLGKARVPTGSAFPTEMRKPTIDGIITAWMDRTVARVKPKEVRKE